MASNIGSELWMNRTVEVSRQQVNQVLQAQFKPEFLNRIDEIVIFHVLTREDLKEIVSIQMQHVSSLLADKGFHLEISPEAAAHLAEVGYDPNFGARPLKRAIQREVQDPLAMRLLQGEFKPGDTILVDLVGEGLTFVPVAKAEPVEN